MGRAQAAVGPLPSQAGLSFEQRWELSTGVCMLADTPVATSVVFLPGVRLQ